uniref:Uncharacterized protein n=1 Tax=Mycena chlorophos TaxID=658473 RepID=A0ABQ0L7F8_MYCCL|nr:predicted protein [Mycena chlorophos]
MQLIRSLRGSPITTAFVGIVADNFAEHISAVTSSWMDKLTRGIVVQLSVVSIFTFLCVQLIDVSAGNRALSFRSSSSSAQAWANLCGSSSTRSKLLLSEPHLSGRKGIGWILRRCTFARALRPTLLLTSDGCAVHRRSLLVDLLPGSVLVSCVVP